MGRGELVVHPMETLYCLEPTDPIDDPGEQAERQEASALFAKLKAGQGGNFAAHARTSGDLANSLARVMSDSGAQRALTQQTKSLPELGTWDAALMNASPRVETPLWSDDAVGLGFAQVLRRQSRMQVLTSRYLKRMRTAAVWDPDAQRVVLTRPFEGAIRVVRASGLIQADMFDGSDPYCEVFWNDERVGTTRVISDSLNPHWNEAFRVLIEPTRTNTLRLEVFDHDDSVLDDEPDFLGEVIVTGIGAGALPLEETDFPVGKKAGPRKVIHTANRTVYEDDTVSGNISIQYSPVARLQKQSTQRRRQKAAPKPLQGRAGRRQRAAVAAAAQTKLPPVKEASSAGRSAAATAIAAAGPRVAALNHQQRPSLSRSSTSSVLTTAGSGMGLCALDHVSATLDLSFRQIGSLYPMPPYARRGRHLEEAATVLLPSFNPWEGDGLAIPPGPTTVEKATNPNWYPGRRSPRAVPMAPRDDDELTVIDSIKLSHNGLQKLTGLGDVMRPYLWRNDLATITSLDLSKNELETIETEAIAPFHNLLFLYLHANPFCADRADAATKTQKTNAVMQSLSKLAPRLTKLRKLTMHGSGIEETPGYRARVLLCIPWLRELDFVSFSGKDREEAKQMGKNRAMWRNPWLVPQGGGVQDYCPPDES
jgi:Leucine-rich repeat (LRR) protein